MMDSIDEVEREGEGENDDATLKLMPIVCTLHFNSFTFTLWNRRAIGLRIKENKEVYEGEVRKEGDGVRGGGVVC